MFMEGKMTDHAFEKPKPPGRMTQIQACVISLMVSVVLAGCAGQKREVTYQPGEYQEFIERQKAGHVPPMDQISESPAKDLSAQELNQLGDLYLQQGNPTLAIVQYHKAVEADPLLFRIHYKIGEMFVKKGLPHDALEHFQEVLKKDERDVLSLEGIGEAYFRMGNEKDAEASFHKALEVNPDRWQTRNLLGTLLDRQKRHEEAIAQYEQALQVKPNEASLHNNIGLAYYLQGRYEDAVSSFHYALRTGSSQQKIHNNLGLALAKLNRFQDALDSFKNGGNDAEAYNNLGVYYLSNDKAGPAVACFQKAIEVSPRYYDKGNDNLALARRTYEKSTRQEGATIKHPSCLP